MYNITESPSAPLQTREDDIQIPTIPVVVILSLLSFGTVLGNSVVFVAIYTHPGLRRVTYLSIFSLAIADFLVGMIAMPSYIMKKLAWNEPITTLVCDLFRFSYFVTGYASILSLCVISVERLIAVKNSLRYAVIVTRRRVVVALVFIWIDALVISLLPFVPWPSITPYMECNYEPTRWWSIMVITTNVIAPFLVIATCYTYMYLTAKSHIRKITSDKKCKENNLDQQRKENNERRANITIMIVIGVFVASWFPSCFYYFLQKTCLACFSSSFKSSEGIVNALVKIFTFASSFANPIIYCWRSREFRSIFVKIFLRKRQRFSESISKYIHRCRRNPAPTDSKRVPTSPDLNLTVNSNVNVNNSTAV